MRSVSTAHGVLDVLDVDVHCECDILTEPSLGYGLTGQEEAPDVLVFAVAHIPLELLPSFKLTSIHLFLFRLWDLTAA